MSGPTTAEILRRQRWPGGAPPARPNGRKPKAPAPEPGAFANYRLRPSEDGPVKAGLSARTLQKQLLKLTGGYPKRVGRTGPRLFAVDGDRPLWLETPEALFAWIAGQLPGEDGNAVRWAQGEDKVTRGDFFAFLRQNVERFEQIEATPHHPPLPGCYYLPAPTRGDDGKALAAFLGQFTPAGPVDADLLKAAVLTPFWGGPPGRRPGFLIESEEDDAQGGRGVGKTTFALAVAALAGGHIDARPGEDIDKLMTRLLSPAALDRRVALLDNIKVLRFSWADLEALITADVISGRALYVGEGRRPNVLTWLLTLNSASLSRDMAQRHVPIRLKRPPHDPDWEETTWRLIEERRWEIVGDILAELRRPAAKLARFSRWSAWEQAVLARVAQPADCQKVIAERQESIDDDQAEADLVRHAFEAELRLRGHDPERDAVWLSAAVAAQVVNGATGERWPINRATKYLATLTVHELRKSNRAAGRGWAWRGPKADPKAAATDLLPAPEEVRDPWR